MTSQHGTILIIDDEAHILQVLSLKLRNAGYGVLTAVDGEEGLDVAVRERPTLIITDFQMPYMTGVELCRALAAHEQMRDIPVFLLTARGYALDQDDLAVGNIRQVLTKPFSPRAIVAQVDQLLRAGRPEHQEHAGTNHAEADGNTGEGRGAGITARAPAIRAEGRHAA